MFTDKEALILVLELAEQAALEADKCDTDLQEIAQDQAAAILVVYEDILDKM